MATAPFTAVLPAHDGRITRRRGYRNHAAIPQP